MYFGPSRDIALDVNVLMAPPQSVEAELNGKSVGKVACYSEMEMYETPGSPHSVASRSFCVLPLRLNAVIRNVPGSPF